MVEISSLFGKLFLVFDPDLLLSDPWASPFLGTVSRPLRRQKNYYTSSQQLGTGSPHSSSTTGQLAACICPSVPGHTVPWEGRDGLREEVTFEAFLN